MLTIREAAEKTGHSPHKIRRLIKAIAEKPDHAERSRIEPSIADVERLTAEGVQFTWRVDEELVQQQLGASTLESAGSRDDLKSRVGESSDVLAVLQRAIDAKEKVTTQLFEQLRVKDEQIAALNDRLRESNVLMQSLQKQLPEPSVKPVALVESGRVPTSKQPGKGTANGGKKKRRGWFHKLISTS